MKQFTIILSLALMLLSPMANATLNLNVKIAKMVENQLVEVNENISTDYGKEIVISAGNLKSKIVLNFKKFSNILVNGQRIHPVQVDMKIVDEMKKIIGRPQTVTSFYNRTAQFSAPSSSDLSDANRVNVSLNFEETN